MTPREKALEVALARLLTHNLEEQGFRLSSRGGRYCTHCQVGDDGRVDQREHHDFCPYLGGIRLARAALAMPVDVEDRYMGDIGK